MNVAIWGATGATGSELLRQCLNDDRVEGIRIFVRAPVPMLDERVRQFVIGDFSDSVSYEGKLADVDVAFWCLGVSQSAVPDPAEYKEITVGFLRAARLPLSLQSEGVQFHFVSAMGVKSFWSRFVMWARLKSTAEDVLADSPQSGDSARLGFSRLVIWRPGYICVPGGRRKPTRWERRWQKLEPLFRLVPGLVNPVPDLARAMLRDAVQERVEKTGQAVEIRTAGDINRDGVAG